MARPRSLEAPWKPETTPKPRPVAEKPAKSWLRRLFSSGKPRRPGPRPRPLASAERQHLRRLAFGAYVGLLRQVSAGDDEGHRVRRDAVDRVVKLTQEGYAGQPAAVAALLRALEDPHQLVRKAALAGLKELYPAGSDEPLALALASLSQDVARAALDELAARGDVAPGLASPPRSTRRCRTCASTPSSCWRSSAPRAAWSRCWPRSPASTRTCAWASSSGWPAPTTRASPRRSGRAMASEHEDLRLRASELLAWRKDDRAVEVLGAFLRSENAANAKRAMEALARLASPAAVGALAGRLRTSTEPDERNNLVSALGHTRHPEAVDVLARRCWRTRPPAVRLACITAAMAVADRNVKPLPDGTRT